MNIEEIIKAEIRNIPDFPKPGIQFKDITPILQKPQLTRKITEAIRESVKDIEIDVVAGIEATGFLFGMLIAEALEVPFVPVRKKGKLPAKVVSHEYSLEYGTDIIEMHADAFKPGSRVLIHDDLLATGGTASAAAQLVEKMGGSVAAFSFLVSLNFLNGVRNIDRFSKNILTLAAY